ncbi:MAG TPA: M56 family metallopeptidase [Candidatus Sulfotelmatobacter sp.]|nr:M56 family metallopeptidase [Candidatus Sulfotelmatobacter sp.]
MLEHIRSGFHYYQVHLFNASLYYYEVHLFYASAVAIAAWILTSIRWGSATIKYWIWVATTLNFILPIGAVLDKSFTAHLGWATPFATIGDLAYQMMHGAFAPAVCIGWSIAVIVMLGRLSWRIHSEHHEGQSVRKTFPAPKGDWDASGVPVRLSESDQAPAVTGVLRPHISLPRGIERLLSEHELDAVVLHELTHARRRDNLIRLIYEVTRCLFWFHPLVWIAGSRLALYRELSCDESVIEKDHGKDLVSALAKLANPEEPLLLQASASSFLGLRLAHLSAAQPKPASRTGSAAVLALFGAVLAAGVLGTVAHTACCWMAKH